MSQDLVFLDFSGLEDQLKNELLKFLYPLSKNPEVELPWDPFTENISNISKGDGTYLNVFAPAFQSAFISNSYMQKEVVQNNMPCLNTYTNGLTNPLVAASEFVPTSVPKYHSPSATVVGNTLSNYNYHGSFQSSAKVDSCTSTHIVLAQNGSGQRNLDTHPRPPFDRPLSSFKLCPTVSSFIPQKLPPFLSRTTGAPSSVKVIDAPVNIESPRQLVTSEATVIKPVETQPDKSTKSNVCDASNFTPVSTSNRPALDLPKTDDDQVPQPGSDSVPQHCSASQSVAEHVPQSVVDHVPQSVTDRTPESVTDHTPQTVTDHTPQSVTDHTPQSVTDRVPQSVTDRVPQSVTDRVPQSVTDRTPQSVTNRVPQSVADRAPQSVVEHVPQPVECVPQPIAAVAPSLPRSWADVLKNKSDTRTANVLSTVKKPVVKQQNTVSTANSAEVQEKKSCIKEDHLAIRLGRHLYDFKHEFSVTNLQPRGLINRRNWCYINATLQALLACSPFYTLLRNLPLGPGVERGKSSTPVIDSMVKLSYEFTKIKEELEDIQPGTPFQPQTVYEMIGTLKSDCLRGQQEDAEEILSFILNGMHEEMAAVIKNYEDQYNLNVNREVKTNGHVDESDAEDEWQVIGAKQRGMVTRKVIEHKTPISDMLGGQIKSILTTNGNKTSASVQPFFTLQLDIQSDAVTSVEEALNQMTVKEPVQGYTCAKTKQEVEAYSRNMLQKLPPVLILHLKRFVYLKQWDGGCKKLMKHIQYPIDLEFKKELFTPEARKMKRPSSYKLIAVIYHDGSEAILGHYICDIYHFGSKCWLRCDDRSITTITEAQVLSHSPPRVPYLLFYQVCNPERVNGE